MSTASTINASHDALVDSPIHRDSRLTFPPEALVGSLGELARALGEGTEVPEEFYFAAALTFLGATCGNRLKLDAALKIEPRLFTVLLGESGDVKKSSALRNTADFFESAWSGRPATVINPVISHGVGSAEGLARILKDGVAGVVLCCDELKALVAKTTIQSSTLLPMVATLFEQNRYENATKKKSSLRVDDAQLSLVGCCTTQTYGSMWTSEAIAIGFPNRLFVVSADRKRKICWPEPRDAKKLDAIRIRLNQQLARLPITFGIDSDAKEAWGKWYDRLPSSIHAKRLDSIGFRLFGLIALTTDKQSIDLEVVETVIKILDYELDVRTVTDPIDADRTVARLEESIRRNLRTRGALTERELRRRTNADRDGLWMFRVALENLITAQDISRDTHGGRLRLSSNLSSAP